MKCPHRRPALRSNALAAAALAAFAAWQPASAGTTLVIGTVDEDAREETGEFEPFTIYLERHLQHAGVTDVRVTAHTTIQSIATAIGRGEIDLYIDSPVLAVIVSRQSGARPFLRAWKEGDAEYHSVIYGMKDRIVSLDDLRGKVIAFKSPESTPGHFVPRAFLLGRGYRLVQVSGPEAAVPADAIGYVFAHGDRTALAWVMKGIVAAAVVKNSFFDQDLRQLHDRLGLVGRTPAVPRQVLMQRPDLDADLRAALEEVLLRMHHVGEGRRALEIMHDTAKFDRFPGGAESALASVSTMLDLIERERGAGGGASFTN